MTLELKITGNKKLTKALKKIADEKRYKLQKATKKAAEHLLIATLKVTPMDTGKLRISGKVKSIKQGYDPVVAVSFSAPYAGYVHEMPNRSTNWTTPGTGSKFLEKTERVERQNIKKIIRNGVR